MSAEHRFILDHEGDVAVAVGEIDASTCAILESGLSTDSAEPVTCIDMSGVTFIDSSGLRVLVAHREVLSRANQPLELRNASASVIRLLEITGLAGIFTTQSG